MSFEAENDLERALMRAPTEPEARPEFYRLLLDSHLFIIGQIGDHAPEKGQVTPRPGERLMIATIEYQGKNCHPVFSALSRLQAFVREEVQYLSMPGRQLFEATKGAHFLLNPGSDYGKELTPDELASVTGSQRVLIGQPSVHPQKLIDGLKELFASEPSVAAAYMIHIAFEAQNEPPHPLIGVEAEGDWQALSSRIGEVLKESADSIVDMVPVNRKEQPTAIVQALLKTAPFYSRA